MSVKNLLWNVPDNFIKIYQMIDDADGELTPEIELELNKIESDEVGRAFSMKAILISMKDKAGLAKAKKAEYGKLQKAFEIGETRIKQWLTDYLQKAGKKELTYEAESIKLRKTPDAVHITDEAEIPDQWKTYTVKLDLRQYNLLKSACEFEELKAPVAVPSIDKAGIKAEYKLNNMEVSGTEIRSGMTVTLKG